MPRYRDRPTGADRLRWALEATDRVIRHTADLDHDAFMASELHQDAVVQQLFQLAENLKALDDPAGSFRQVVPALGDIVGMRNYIAHEYHRLDLEAIWNAAHRSVPRLRTQLMELIESG